MHNRIANPQSNGVAHNGTSHHAPRVQQVAASEAVQRLRAAWAQYVGRKDFHGLGNTVVSVLMRPGQDAAPDELSQCIDELMPSAITAFYGAPADLSYTRILDAETPFHDRGDWKKDRFRELIVQAHELASFTIHPANLRPPYDRNQNWYCTKAAHQAVSVYSAWCQRLYTQRKDEPRRPYRPTPEQQREYDARRDEYMAWRQELNELERLRDSARDMFRAMIPEMHKEAKENEGRRGQEDEAELLRLRIESQRLELAILEAKQQAARGDESRSAKQAEIEAARKKIALHGDPSTDPELARVLAEAVARIEKKYGSEP